MAAVTATPKIPLIEWGVASRPLAGQRESGDLGLVAPFAGGLLVGVVDGLGHGDEAAAAARAASEVLRAQPEAPVLWLMRCCHEALHETRGVVMSLASLSTAYGTLTWIGVGNVLGLLLRADTTLQPPREALLLRGGVVGFNLPQLSASVIPLLPGDTLVFATDGIRSGFEAQLAPTRAPQQCADQILAQHAKETDDALALVAVFLGEAG